MVVYEFHPTVSLLSDYIMEVGGLRKGLIKANEQLTSTEDVLELGIFDHLILFPTRPIISLTILVMLPRQLLPYQSVW